MARTSLSDTESLYHDERDGLIPQRQLEDRMTQFNAGEWSLLLRYSDAASEVGAQPLRGSGADTLRVMTLQGELQELSVTLS